MCNRTKNVLQEKGLYYRPPVLNPPAQAEFVEDKKFLNGWLGEKRPLSAIEITHIYFNLKKSGMTKALLIMACQVGKSVKVRNFYQKALKTKKEHIKMFSDLLSEESLPAPPIFDSEITSSTVPPFSDKLLMFQVGFLFSTAMVYYGTGWASSPRRDLSIKYMSAIMEDLKVANEWTQIMINNGWLEHPPLAEDRSKLAKF